MLLVKSVGVEKKIIELCAPQIPQVTAKCWWNCPSPIASRSLPSQIRESLIHRTGVLPGRASRQSVHAFSPASSHTQPTAEARIERKAKGKQGSANSGSGRRCQNLSPQEVGWTLLLLFSSWLCLPHPPLLSVVLTHKHLSVFLVGDSVLGTQKLRRGLAGQGAPLVRAQRP